MRSLSVAAPAAVCLLFTAMSGDTRAQGPEGPGGKKPERSLSCGITQAPYCDVSCVTTSGQALFVLDRVQTVYVTEFAGYHTVLEIQRVAPDEIVSVLVGDISHCMFKGMRDPTIRER